MLKYNYSVIIPFRDCTDFLRVACASIPVRDDVQVIVVDNAKEPIGAEAIISFNNPHIEYYTSSPFKGAGCARNEGLKHAKGKFLLFWMPMIILHLMLSQSLTKNLIMILILYTSMRQALSYKQE